MICVVSAYATLFWIFTCQRFDRYLYLQSKEDTIQTLQEENERLLNKIRCNVNIEDVTNQTENK